ncbi:MAG: hypothetical protein ACJ79K_04110 [Gemmatimonadaceae bacterium]
MKSYVIVTASIFGLLTIVHLWRVAVESSLLAREPEYLVITALSAALCVWGVRLILTQRATR